MKGNSLQPVHCNSLDDMSDAFKSGATIVEIPDEEWQRITEGSEKRGYLDDPGELGKDGSIIDLSEFPEGTRAVQVGPPLIVDIPDSYIEAVRDSHLGTDQQPSCEGVGDDLAAYRKAQLAFLIGKSPSDEKELNEIKGIKK